MLRHVAVGAERRHCLVLEEGDDYREPAPRDRVAATFVAVDFTSFVAATFPSGWLSGLLLVLKSWHLFHATGWLIVSGAGYVTLMLIPITSVRLRADSATWSGAGGACTPLRVRPSAVRLVAGRWQSDAGGGRTTRLDAPARRAIGFIVTASDSARRQTNQGGDWSVSWRRRLASRSPARPCARRPATRSRDPERRRHPPRGDAILLTGGTGLAEREEDRRGGGGRWRSASTVTASRSASVVA